MKNDLVFDSLGAVFGMSSASALNNLALWQFMHFNTCRQKWQGKLCSERTLKLEQFQSSLAPKKNFSRRKSMFGIWVWGNFRWNIVLIEAFFAVGCGQSDEKNNEVQNDICRKFAKIKIQTYS